jgi:pimeloyl-ACP methyl ester carboxylesterase
MPATAGLRPYYQQQVEWEDCRDGDRCAEVRVPLDYAEPAGRFISLALLKVPADGGGEPVGSLLVNPGGPGGSGVDYAAHAESYFGAEIRDAFDIVGFDPRGVGRSTPIDCLSDSELDEFVASDPDPDTDRERARAKQLLAEFGRGCVQRSGALAAHISTVEVAKDMDIIRAVLGDQRLNYFGASYGTLLGAHYADMFPQRVGRMVLDGAIDPSLTLEEMSLAQAHGFETALRSYVGACVAAGSCFLGGSVDAGVRRIRDFLRQVEEDPLPTAGDRELTAGLAVLGIWAPLYDQQSWPLLDAGLRTAFSGSGEVLIRLADAYTSRGPTGYLDNSMEALYAVNCLDTSAQASIPMSAVPAHIPRFEKASPTFGAIFAYGLASCSTWPFSDDERPHALHAAGAAPILVIGTTRDPATPVRWAEALADQLRSGVLIRRNGDGHTGYGAGNECVDDAVESYLVSGQAPSSDLDC